MDDDEAGRLDAGQDATRPDASDPGPSPFALPEDPPTPPTPPNRYGRPPGFAPASSYGTSPAAVAPTAPGAFGVPQPGQPSMVGTPNQPFPAPRQAVRRSSGLPPSLGFAVMLLSLPALLTFLYGMIALLAGLVFSSISSGSAADDLDLNDAGGAVAAVGGILLVLGLIGIYGVVAMAAGSRSGRMVCTLFLGLVLASAAISSLLSSNTAGEMVITLLIGSLPAVYCLWAMWGGRSREVF